MVLQKMGPDFAMSLGFWAVSCGRSSIRRLPTWGNAGSSRPFKPKPPAKPPRSSERDCTVRKPALPMRSTCASIRANRPNPQHEPPARTLGIKSASALHPRQREASQRLTPTVTRAPARSPHAKPTGATRPRPNATRCKSRQDSHRPSPNRDPCTGPTWPDPACTICKIAGRSKTTRNGASRCRGRSRTGW